ncbi:cocaine- and amphetamine-regulated transcript protein-like [Engystomops pustulosus]|uniref:cocaine- and amphetamine-regulated transcript protein-like n=1 Tax=Engystomops pustulosus TaxID=76066 RepID=UPI003AFAB92D
MSARCPPLALTLCLITVLTSTITEMTSAEAADSSPGVQRYQEKDLLLELQDVLYKLQSKRGQGWEGKFLQVPKCMMGEACAVKRGARIGKLCDCPQRSTCSYFFLRCL